jgi:hypothetical protein
LSAEAANDHQQFETLAKPAFLPDFCVPDNRDFSTGSNFNLQNAQCMDACPDAFFIGMVKIFTFLELEQK